MDKSQNFNILEVNNLKTNKLDYSYSNNILNITTNNSKKIILNSNHSDNILNTQDYNMDINIKLTSQIIGTKHRILITNKQNSLRIYCKNANDKFKGSCKINNNSNLINNDILKNNLTNKIVNINDDICNYNFNRNTILFMYEPLWLCKDYLPVYNKLFKNISNSKHHIYIIYLTSLIKQLQEQNFENFENFKFKLLHKHKHGSILLKRYIYIYSNF